MCPEMRAAVAAVQDGRRNPKLLLTTAGRMMDLCEEAENEANDDYGCNAVAAHDLVQHTGIVVRAHMIVTGIGDRDEHLEALAAGVVELEEALARRSNT